MFDSADHTERNYVTGNGWVKYMNKLAQEKLICLTCLAQLRILTKPFSANTAPLPSTSHWRYYKVLMFLLLSMLRMGSGWRKGSYSVFVYFTLHLIGTIGSTCNLECDALLLKYFRVRVHEMIERLYMVKVVADDFLLVGWGEWLEEANSKDDKTLYTAMFSLNVSMHER